MNYCSHCGSDNVEVVLSENKDYTMYVAEENECSTECYDADIEMLACIDCEETTYKSVAASTKSTRFGSARRPDGRRPVYFLIDGEWEHKGWLLPQVGNDE